MRAALLVSAGEIDAKLDLLHEQTQQALQNVRPLHPASGQ
jgi:hypothetical protein